MSEIDSLKTWRGVFVVSTILLIVLSPGMIKFSFEVSAGNTYMNLMENNIDPIIAKSEAFKTGYATSVLYFVGFPFPVYLLVNLIGARLTRLRIKNRPAPLWIPAIAIYLLGNCFLVLSFMQWNKESAIGVIGIWLLIVMFLAGLVGVGKLLRKIFILNKRPGFSEGDL